MADKNQTPQISVQSLEKKPIANKERKSENSEQNIPDIYKKQEFSLMIELIENGIWKGVNLSSALHVDEDTITVWKRNPDAISAHRRAILKFIRRRTDVEKILRELEIETEPDGLSLVQNNYYQLDDEQLRNFIATKTRKLGIGASDTGVGETEEGRSAQLSEAA